MRRDSDRSRAAEPDCRVRPALVRPAPGERDHFGHVELGIEPRRATRDALGRPLRDVPGHVAQLERSLARRERADLTRAGVPPTSPDAELRGGAGPTRRGRAPGIDPPVRSPSGVLPFVARRQALSRLLAEPLRLAERDAVDRVLADALRRAPALLRGEVAAVLGVEPDRVAGAFSDTLRVGLDRHLGRVELERGDRDGRALAAHGLRVGEGAPGSGARRDGERGGQRLRSGARGGGRGGGLDGLGGFFARLVVAGSTRDEHEHGGGASRPAPRSTPFPRPRAHGGSVAESTGRVHRWFRAC